jgi:uroporphyrinogen decarboxylase
MNGRERLLTAFQHGIPDRVPVSFFVQDYFVKAVTGRDEIDPVADVVRLDRELGMDIMLRPEWMDTTYFTKTSGPDWEVEVTLETAGDRLLERWVVHTPKGDLSQTLVTVHGSREYGFFGWKEHFIKTERDLDLFEEYEPPLSFDIAARMKQAFEAVGEDGIVAPWLPDCPFNQGFYLRGLEPMLTDALTDFTFFDRLMSFRGRQSLTLLPEVIAGRADLGCVGANVGNARLVSLAFYDRYIAPYDQAYVRAIEQAGLPVLFHNCGYSMPFLESYAGLGCRALESLTPPPNADGDLAEAKRRVGDRLVLVGNIDQINLLRTGTADEIERTVCDTVEAGMPGGGFVLSTADHLYDETPIKNVELAVRAAQRCGGY